MIDRMMDKAEVARALGKQVGEFENLNDALVGIGFPEAAAVNDGWRVADLLDWATIQQDINLRFVESLVRVIDITS
jgi:hypothetical protein